MALAYASYKDPKGSGVVVLALGVLLLVGGLWGAIVSRGPIDWFLIGLGGLLVVVGGLFAFVVHWDLPDK